MATKGILEEYLEAKTEEHDLFQKLVQVREKISKLEKHVSIVTSLNGFLPMSTSKTTVVNTPTELAKIIAGWISARVPKGVLELQDSRPLLRRWANEERFHPTIEFKFDGETEEFLQVTLLALEEELGNYGVYWEASGRNVFYNKTRVLNALVPLIQGVVKKV